MINRPNIVWVIADQMRAQAMCHMGDPNVRTPNLDLFAAESWNFERAVSGSPLCSPFRGSMITGKYSHQSTVPGHEFPMDTSVKTIAHAFKANGYRTCWIGKWHLDGNRPELDLSRPENVDRKRIIPKERRGGFEDWWGYENNNRPYDCRVHSDIEGETLSWQLPGYETDCLTDILLEWLNTQTGERQGQPFFAALSVQPPHNPYIAPPEYMAKYQPAEIKLRPNVPAIPRIVQTVRRELAGYYAAIERLDWNFGRIRQHLKTLGLTENTYIFFFSDHGDMHGSHGQFRKTAPWEEAIRIPFIIGGPGQDFYEPRKIKRPLNHVDIAPTTLGLCQIARPEEMVGVDYSPIIKGAPPVQPYAESAYLSIPVPTGHYYSVDRAWRGVVTLDEWKYIELEGLPWLMFNLTEDPYEQANLAHDTGYIKQRKILQERLQQWMKDTGDNFSNVAN